MVTQTQSIVLVKLFQTQEVWVIRQEKVFAGDLQYSHYCLRGIYK